MVILKSCYQLMDRSRAVLGDYYRKCMVEQSQKERFSRTELNSEKKICIEFD